MRRASSLWNHEALGVGTYRKVVSGENAADMSFRWVQHTGAAADNAALVSFYSADYLPTDDVLSDTDPTTNPYWSFETTAVYSVNPGTAIASDVLTLTNNPYGALLVQVVVTTALPNFSLTVRSAGRGGRP